MRFLRSARGVLGLATAFCLTAAAAGASEVTDILNDLDGNFRSGHETLERAQARLDKLELGLKSRAGRQELPQVAGELDRIGSDATKALASLREKLAKVETLESALYQKFPEDRHEVSARFASFRDWLSSAQALEGAVAAGLAQVRSELASNYETGRSAETRGELLEKVKTRHLQRERRAAQVRTAPVPQPMAPQPVYWGAPPYAAAAPPVPYWPAIGYPQPQAVWGPPHYRVVAPAMGYPAAYGHPPVAPMQPQVPADEAGPVPAPVSSPVELDLEQLIMEMEQ